MNTTELVELIGIGNNQAVATVWSSLLESPDHTLDELGNLDQALKVMVSQHEFTRAEELAWEAIESLSSRFECGDLVPLAGRYLLALGDSKTVRKQVLELYQKAYLDQEGLDALLEEAGLGGGRPVRRAIRTLNVCLALQEGDYLAARDEDGAVLVKRIDRTDWEITLQGSEGEETLGAVHLADGYQPASETSFRVMKIFFHDTLMKKIDKEPASIVSEICLERGGRMDSIDLENILVPDCLSESGWKKWWTRARTALKKNPNIELEGRSPYTITYVDKPQDLEAGVIKEYKKIGGPVEKLAILERYVQECKLRGQTFSLELLENYSGQAQQEAEKLAGTSPNGAALWWAVVRQIANLRGSQDFSEAALAFYREATDLQPIMQTLVDNQMVAPAMEDFLEAQRPDEDDQLLALLPMMPHGVCDVMVKRLLMHDADTARLESMMQSILSSPVQSFEALAWLWDGPTQEDKLPAPGLVAIFSRILRAVDECRRTDSLPKEKIKAVTMRARSVLTLRKHARFKQMLEDLDPSMASAIRTQLRKQDSLGRAAREDLVRLLDRKYPPVSTQKQVPPWELEDTLFVTELGFARKQDEIDHHVNVVMKKNAEAIGRAAERGDLSENSEFKFALEERDLLRARLAQMNSELSMAKVLNVDEVQTDHVNIGTRVAFKRTTDGDPYEITFFGPWESDTEKGWLNYRAPLSQKVLGKKMGEKIIFEHSGAEGEYEIVSITNALKEME